MLYTTGKENLSLFILLVLFIIDIDTYVPSYREF